MTPLLLSLCLLGLGRVPMPVSIPAEAAIIQGAESAPVRSGISEAANNRRDAVAKVLTSEAKDKLKQASHDLLVDLASTPVATDPTASANKVLNRLFGGLSKAQLDVMLFYTLVEAGHLTTNEDVMNKMLGVDASKLTKPEEYRLHHLLDDRKGYVAAIDRSLSKIASVPDRVVDNVK